MRKKMTAKEIMEKSERDKQLFVENRKKEACEKEDVKDLAAEKIAARILKGIPLEEISEELIEKCIDVDIKKILDHILDKKTCPMLTRDDSKWDCLKSNCKKGEETFCRTIDFLNCPAMNNYFNHEMVMKSQRKRSKKKV